MSDNFKRLEDKLDKLDQRLDNIDVTLVKQEGQLREHILRTEINEENISLLREQVQPIENHVIMINGVLKFFGLVSLLVGISVGIIKIIEFFS